MNRYLLIVLAIIAFSPLSAQEVSKNQLYVKTHSKILDTEGALRESLADSIKPFLSRYGVLLIERTFRMNDPEMQAYYTFTFTEEETKNAFLKVAPNVDWIEFAEQVPLYRLFYTPNDLHANQWHLSKVGATGAWDISKGDVTITIAIVDDAVLTTHEDLQDVIWNNPGEVAGNGSDDDNNGYIDDINGWDAADNDNNPNPPTTGVTATNFSHGTHCAGIAGAKTDNNTGIASLAFNARIIPVKTKMSSTSGGSLQATLQGVEYAIAAGARIISMSFGGYASSQTWQKLIDKGHSKGIVFVAAAGNDDIQLYAYPAGYDHVIGVGATDHNDLKASFSNFGGTVDVMAPGTNIWSTLATSNSTYGNMSGTSMACPLVSSLSALMLSVNPVLTPEQLLNCLESTADNIYGMNPGPIYAGNLGSGRINAQNALRCVKPIYANFTSDYQSVCPGGQVQYNDLSYKDANSWSWEFQGGNPSTSSQQNPLVTYNSTGSYRTRLIATNNKGSDTIELFNYIRVGIPHAAISGNHSFPSGFSANLRVDLSGQPPFRIKFNNGNTSMWYDGIMQSPFYITVTPSQSVICSIDSVEDYHCFGSVSGSCNLALVNTGTGSCSDGIPVFQKLYPASGSDLAHGVIPCQEGGYAFWGRTNTSGSGNYDIFFMRTNDTGKILWSKTYGTSGIENGWSIKAIQNKDSGFTITFNSTGVGSAEEIMVLTLDKNGTLVMQRKFGGSTEDLSRALIRTLDNGLIITGSTQSNPKSGLQDAYVTKLDSNGNVLWSKKHGFAGGTTNHLTAAIELESGNIVCIGAGDHGVTAYVSYLAKYSPTGTVLMERRVYTPQFDGVVCATRTADGNILTTGLWDNGSGSGPFRLYLIKFDTSLNVIWSKTLHNASNSIRGTALAPTFDSGVVVLANEIVAGKSDLAWIRLDSAGSVIWAKRFGNSTGEEISDPFSISLRSCSDGGYVLTGSSNGLGHGNTQNLLLLKLNSCGSSGDCNEINATYTITNLNLTNTNVTSNINSGFSATSTSVSSGNFNVTDTISLCYTPPASPVCKLKADFDLVPACKGEASSFMDRSIDSNGNAVVKWTWIIDGNDTVPDGNELLYPFATVGNHAVKLIVGTDDVPACFDTLEKSVTIHDQLHFDLLLSDTVCENDSIYPKIHNIVCALGPLTFRWSPGNIFTDSTDGTAAGILKHSQWVKVQISDSIGKTYSDSVFVFVDPTCCRPVAYWKGNPGFVCLGDSLQLINESVAKPGATYDWSFGPSSSQLTFNGFNPPKITYPASGSYDVSVRVQDQCGSDTFTASVFILPLPVSSAIADTNLCASDTVQLGHGVNLAGFDYLWSPGSLLTDSTTIEALLYITDNTSRILTILNTWTGCITRDTVEINLIDFTDLNLGNDTTFCGSGSIQYDFTGRVSTMIWENANASLVRTLMDTGTYWAQFNRNGCLSIDSIIVKNALSPATISGPSILCDDDSAVYLLNQRFDTIFWSNGSTDTFTWLDTSGLLTVEVKQDGCTDTASILVSQFDSLNGIFGVPHFCYGDSTVLWVGKDNSDVEWHNGISDTSIWVKTEGYVGVTVTKRGCSISDSLFVVGISAPFVEFGPDTVFCEGSAMLLNVPSLDSILWNDGSDDSVRVIVSPGKYVVAVSNQCGFIVDSITVNMIDCACEVYIPNAFTPGQDNLNDRFKVNSCPMLSFRLIIFDRWGGIIYETDDINAGWSGEIDGTAAPEGVYAYLMEIIHATGKRQFSKGTFHLLRAGQ